ncbi:MAG: hypothetical protein AAFO01_19740 [Pseudomonadota bacterium]
MSDPGDNIITIRPPGDRVRLAFLGWQCRLRQLAVRENDARPSAGMRPTLTVAGQDAGAITVVIVPADPDASTREFRHIVRRTHDPRERYQAALRYLQAYHFQDPTHFDDRLTAIFGIDTTLPALISWRNDCILSFSQFGQRYQLPCRAERLDQKHKMFQATYWHNALFNPSLPANVDVLCFRPDWNEALAEPPPA